MPLARAVGNELGAAYALGYLASVSFELGEFDRAAGYAGDAAAARAEPGVEGHFSAALGLLAEAQLAARDGRVAEASETAQRGERLIRRGGAAIEVAYSLIVRARIRRLEGRSEDVRADLHEAREILATCRDPGLAGDLLARAEAPVARPPVRAGEELSERELAVLRMLATQLTRREIGAALYVSLNTVKTHTRGIFRKLDASTRAEAVEHARARGLL